MKDVGDRYSLDHGTMFNPDESWVHQSKFARMFSHNIGKYTGSKQIERDESDELLAHSIISECDFGERKRDRTLTLFMDSGTEETRRAYGVKERAIACCVYAFNESAPRYAQYIPSAYSWSKWIVPNHDCYLDAIADDLDVDMVRMGRYYHELTTQYGQPYK